MRVNDKAQYERRNFLVCGRVSALQRAPRRDHRADRDQIEIPQRSDMLRSDWGLAHAIPSCLARSRWSAICQGTA
jgi:hypothetical protein